jgi:hypothetical protein
VPAGPNPNRVLGRLSGWPTPREGSLRSPVQVEAAGKPVKKPFHFSKKPPARARKFQSGFATKDHSSDVGLGRGVHDVPEREAMMGAAAGTLFVPEEIELVQTTLDEVVTMLPVSNRTPAMRSRLASRIRAAAAKGERDPVQLRICALLAPADE